MSIKNKISVKEYVDRELRILNSFKKFNLETELWNIMYNLSDKYAVKVGDDVEILSELAKNYIEAHLIDIYNYFPNKKL